MEMKCEQSVFCSSCWNFQSAISRLGCRIALGQLMYHSKHFGTREWFHGRHFFPQMGEKMGGRGSSFSSAWVEGWFQVIWYAPFKPAHLNFPSSTPLTMGQDLFKVAQSLCLDPHSSAQPVMPQQWGMTAFADLVSNRQQTYTSQWPWGWGPLL